MQHPEFPERVSKKMCVGCGALIPEPAVKCTVCSSFQDWRRGLPFDATILALLTALISVTATLVTPLLNKVRGHHSDVKLLQVVDDGAGGIFVKTYNEGDRPGDITSVTLVVPFQDEDTEKKFKLTPAFRDGSSQDTSLTPGYKLVQYNFDYNFPDIAKPRLPDSCSIEVVLSDFGGNNEAKFPEHREIKCQDISTIKRHLR